MAFDGITIANIVKELRETLPGARISKIAQPEADELLLTFKTADGQKRLSLSASASLPLVYLTEANKPGPLTAPNFCMLLRKHISGGRITDITQPDFERVIRFEIEHLDELGDLCKKYLILEIMGKHSNLIFCDAAGRIIDSIKHVSAQVSSVREVLPGRSYFIPKTEGKRSPLETDYAAFFALLRAKPVPLAKAIYTSYTGISPVVAEGICFAAGADSSIPPKDLPEACMRAVYERFARLFSDVAAGRFTPAIYYQGETPREFSSVLLPQYAGLARREFASVSELLETYYASKSALTRIRQKSSDLRRIVQTALERSRRKYELQEKQLRDTDDRDTFRVFGELLLTYGYFQKPGADHLECLNHYTGQTVRIPLDPAATVQENAQNYFERYNKKKRAGEALAPLIQETREEIAYLESVTASLDIASGEDDLSQIREELTDSGYIRRRSGKKKGAAPSRPLHYLSSDGFDIYVGKNNLQNEELTFSLAAPNDWWFHAKGCPGSHVVVKTNGKELPDRTFEEAGRLAAYYSKNRGGEKVEIDYVEKKHVKKPNGKKPGFVVYYTNYSLTIDSDISALKEVK